MALRVLFSDTVIVSPMAQAIESSTKTASTFCICACEIRAALIKSRYLLGFFGVFLQHTVRCPSGLSLRCVLRQLETQRPCRHHTSDSFSCGFVLSKQIQSSPNTRPLVHGCYSTIPAWLANERLSCRATGRTCVM